MSMGKFLCMLLRDKANSSMILLDLVGKEGLAEKMAEKLGHVDLQDKLMNVYQEIISHPENHRKFKLVMGDVDLTTFF
jgi:hypothetical protein